MRTWFNKSTLELRGQTTYIKGMDVEIARIHPDARLPEYKTDGAACFDLEAVEETTIQPGEIKLVRTGLVFRAPAGYFLCIAPRSSMPKLGLDMPHSFGILDPDYSGPEDEAKILVRNFTDRPVKLEKYQRLAQAYFAAAPRVSWKELSKDELGDQSRGGFGSTGPK